MSNGLEIGGSVECVSSHEEQLDEVASDVSTSDVKSTGEMREGETFVDGDDMSNSISRIDDDSSLKTCGGTVSTGD